ncbi:MAG: PIG-L deacetylase family protein [Propioniciclava sp.]
MATIVFVHAHPDDEASQTSGTMARAVEQGHRVVCIYATGGEQGTRPAALGHGSLADLRREEAEASAAVIGTHRLVWLGYRDSGMAGWESNTAAGALWVADQYSAIHQVTRVLEEEAADAVVGYDWHGGYGHPDHVMVHRITKAAAERAQPRPRYLEVSMNRDRLRRMVVQAVAAGLVGEADAWDVDAPQADGNPVGTPEEELAWAVDVSDQLVVKRAALSCHASQEDAAGMLMMPPEAFAAWMSEENYAEPGRPPGMVRAWPFV